jgi:hypothetical protein
VQDAPSVCAGRYIFRTVLDRGHSHEDGRRG